MGGFQSWGLRDLRDLSRGQILGGSQLAPLPQGPHSYAQPQGLGYVLQVPEESLPMLQQGNPKVLQGPENAWTALEAPGGPWRP